MANIEVPTTGEVVHHEHRTTHSVAAGGSAVEALAGLGAVVLSILGLAGLLVVPFAAIATIAVGAALLFEAAAVASRARGAYGETSHLVKGSVGADTIAAVAAIVLGILSLIGIDPRILLPISAIVLGAGLLFSSGAPAAAEREGVYEGGEHGLVHESLIASSGVHALVGAGAIVLGIIGVLGTDPITMTLISMLSIGGAALLAGAATSGRFMGMLHHRHHHGV